MTKRFRYSICLYVIILFVIAINIQKGFAQTQSATVKGLVFESGSGLPLKQVFISVAATGLSTETDNQGKFVINIPNKQAELIINLPGYVKRRLFILDRDSITISLVADTYKSMDENYNSPLGATSSKDATYAVSVLKASDLDLSKSTSFDQTAQGQVAGLRVIQHSGMPGSRTWMNIRGISSIYGKNQPLLFIDGMIHDYDYTNLSLMEGFTSNALDIVDIEDVADLSILKNGDSHLGGAGSNGVINVNTELKSEASSLIYATAYTGIALVPKNLDVFNSSENRNYLNQFLSEQGMASEQVNTRFPWLNGNSSTPNYYKYSNSTDWQKEIFKPALLNKAYLFIKGGDEIATYNISTGYLKQGSVYENSEFSRFNLRINGNVNITDKFSVAPNAKLSLSDSYLPNQGPTAFKNPILSAVNKPTFMAVNARDSSTGVQLPFLDGVGDLTNVSNPSAIVNNAIGQNKNYHFLSSVNVGYKFNSHLSVSNLTGIDYNSVRENIFLPNLGMAQIAPVYNSAGEMTNEYRSTQNHTTINFKNETSSGHAIEINAGMRYMENFYKNVTLNHVNTPSDDLKKLQDGTTGKYEYLRSSTGYDRGLLWMSYYASTSYSFQNKYFINGNLSYDSNSAVSKNNRYNLYPSVGIAWRLSSESFLSQVNWLEDLKLRASWSQTGNIFSNIYDYSKLYYSDARIGDYGVVTREAIPNDDIEIEKKSTINVGLDITLFQQLTNIRVDYFKSNVDNLIINQNLEYNYGYTNYYNNGGKLENSGVEVSFEQRIHFGELVWTIGGSIAKQTNEITSLDFINLKQKNIVTSVDGAQYVTSKGYSVNSFYGYKTNGIYTNNDPTNQIGPKGKKMQAGDVRFVDNGDGQIDENDKTIIGDPNPDFYGGFSTSFAFKGFEFSALFTYSMGNDAFNYVKYKGESMDSYGNQLKTVSNRYPFTNNMPRAALGDPAGNTSFSDRWIEDASFVRLKQLSVSYALPETRFYKGLTLYITAANLLTFTSFTGYDPEFMYMNSPFSMGIDYGSIPQTQSFILGIKLGL